jgi:hypothetical protein
VRSGGGDAGNLILDAPFIITESSGIIANAFGGRGGNIRLGAEVFLADPATFLSSSSTGGLQGITDPRALVAATSMSQTSLTVAALLPVRCTARAQDGRYSSLVLGGRGGLPPAPDGVLPSPLALEERLATDPAGIGASSPPPPARFAFLADQEKTLPRLGCPK